MTALSPTVGGRGLSDCQAGGTMGWRGQCRALSHLSASTLDRPLVCILGFKALGF